MKALVKAKPEKGIWLEDVEVPQIGAQDVLIKVNKMAICGTDMHIYHWDEWAQKTINTPMTVGHEFAGEIVELGCDVSALEVGMRVSAEGHITCGMCRKCRGGQTHLCPNTIGIGVNRAGSFAEYVSVPARNVIQLPDNITDDQGAVLDPLGNATHTALSFDLVGEDVLITGAGPIGIMACAIAKKVGARHVVITDVNDYRLAMAKKMGATYVVNIKHTSIEDIQQALNMTEGFDIGLEMSGVGSAFNSMIDNLSHGARVALLGILSNDVTVDWHKIIFKGIELKGIYGREMFETWYKMIALLQSGLDISPVITNHYKVSEYEQAFETMGSGQSGKVILEW